MDFSSLTMKEIAKKISCGETSAVEVTENILKEIENKKRINAFITVCGESALLTARRIDEKIAAGEKVGPLAGVPVAVKDNIAVGGEKMTCASAFLKNYVSPYDATVVRKLREAGAVIIGKTNMDEFAMGASNKNSAFGSVENPLDSKKVPGGSSGGSAAAVAAGTCYAALGTDTGGSVRQPSAFCGTVGLKPTYSSVGRFGVTAFASSLDQVGTITRTVRDNALLYSVVCGKDERDGTSANVNFELAEIKPRLKGLKIGILRQFTQSELLTEEVEKAFFAAMDAFGQAEAKTEYVSVPSFTAGIAAYTAISCAEAASTLSRFDGIRYGERAEGKDYAEICALSRARGFGDEVKKRVMTGNFVLCGNNYEKYYVTAMKMRTRIKNELNAALKDYDVIALPTSPTTALGFDFKPNTLKEKYYGDMFTVIANLAGNPALSVPIKTDGMPVGLQLIGRAFDEKTLYSAALAYESEIGLCKITK